MRAGSGTAKTRLLDAAVDLIRSKGYAATSVDELCRKAGVTKGAFFHHFDSKDELAAATADHWSEVTTAMFAAAPYSSLADPLDRLLGYIDFRRSILKGAVEQFSCLAGTLVQETFDSHPPLRKACERSICGHADRVAADIAAACNSRGIKADWTPESLALYTQAVLQGAFILAKVKGSSEVAVAMVDHLKRYVTTLFQPASPTIQPAS